MAENAPNTLLETHSDKQSQRLIFAYKSCSLFVLAMSIWWCAVFSWNQWWALAGAEVVISLIALLSWLQIRAGRLNAALIISEIAFLVSAIAFCLMLDIPNAQFPRVAHLFLPVIAMIAYINYLRKKSYFQLAVIVTSLCAFVVFASTNLAFPLAQTVPDSVRIGGTWINAILAAAMMCGCIYALGREVAVNRPIVRELRAAVRNGELELFYQPQVDKAANVIGAEALLRWKHPQRGMIAPADFIPLAEESGLMPLVGGWVLKEACRTLSIWSEDPALAELTLAVNVSASQFHVAGFERSVLETVTLFGIDATRLKLELTESVIITGMEEVVAKMDTLRAAGITFALDDFGTGYSSLSYLRRLPLHQLKVDRSFVLEALESPRGAALVRSIVQIGKDLGFVVLAEGVETPAQYAFLLDCGCHQFQGYHFGRPVSREGFEGDTRASISAAKARRPRGKGVGR